MASTCMILRRGISTTCVCNGARNFRKFLIYNKRGSRLFKKKQHEKPDPDVPIDRRGVKPTGYREGNCFVNVPEMIPELIVPSLADFNLKPYVSYRAERREEVPFTPYDLFKVVYGPKILSDYENGKLDLDGQPLEPSEEEKLTPSEAKARAGSTGCDIFTTDRPKEERITETQKLIAVSMK
ncbi:39S ribosomal protein L41, mitochondrial [Cephus cinctus]|uniref:39S ribosomal protein L41, mitochondrial n=1 Tax=Cephus cinctus TaxID=211228 RepID=A0AAJ7BJY9_CEPCN|nr:39S ribosomal protein L41, mitochondrial [Cephus cinctus]XP_024937304.1 39S ribosomal protein L41, mitochondrial [Cephus cinctus]